MIKTFKTSRTAQFGAASVTLISVLLQNKDTITPLIDGITHKPEYSAAIFLFLNCVVAVGSIYGIAKFRKEGDGKPLIKERQDPFVFGLEV